MTIRGDTDFSHTEQLDRSDVAGQSSSWGWTRIRSCEVGRRPENKAWKPFEREPKYEILTEPRQKAFRCNKKRLVGAVGGSTMSKLVGEALAEIEYQSWGGAQKDPGRRSCART